MSTTLFKLHVNTPQILHNVCIVIVVVSLVSLTKRAMPLNLKTVTSAVSSHDTSGPGIEHAIVSSQDFLRLLNNQENHGNPLNLRPQRFPATSMEGE